ncbi:hypothetical protein GQ457_02G024100 [Hibiscus cannabinus]
MILLQVICAFHDLCQEWSTRKNKEEAVSWQSEVAEYQPRFPAQTDKRTYQRKREKLVKVKDLKLKRIKGYLEYKFIQRSPALLKGTSICLISRELNSRNEVNTVHVRDQKHELTPPRNRTRCLYSRHPLCHPVEAEYRSPSIEEVEASTIDPEATID